jgi:prevent-host-death family protein
MLKLTRNNLAEARQNLPDLASRAGYGGERIILARKGRAIAVLVSLRDLEALAGC